ncbi:DHA1 family putative efflux transporter-like MFS transporter [Paenibacillus taihuensis]|uniref:DHA1 family putative efflux transporter-like MFS transporter n=1 Tax=Paenibacillus taihuensis TaxID=1156355 RepID=A0A3D9RNK3_9BACL|nr:MFS transporter [Paenibacillus taihuensis]REE81048.1 DHA1 family putative efflux transporter-like MFS transporter [Paenibacillus taihuensis]
MSNSFKIILLALITFFVGTSEYVIAGFLDIIAKDTGISVASAGQLISIFSLSYAIGTPILVALTARMDRKKLLLASLITFVIGNAMVISLPGYLPLLLSRIVLALSAGIFLTVSITMAAKLAKPEKIGSAISTVVMGFSTSFVIGIPLGRLVAANMNWKLNFAALGILGLASIFVLMAAIPHTEGEEPIPLVKQLAFLKNTKILMALVVIFFWILGYSIAFTYITPFLLNAAHMNTSTISAALFIFGVASMIGAKIGGSATDKWGVRKTLLSGLIIHAISLALLALSVHSVAAVFFVLVLWSLSLWSSGPTQQVNLVSQAPEASSIMISLYSSTQQLSMAIGAGLGGIVLQNTSINKVVWLGSLGVAIAAIIAIRVIRPEVKRGH